MALPLFDAAAAPGWADWLGLGLTVLGFAVAIIQATRARRAAAAAADALKRAEARLRLDALFALPAALADTRGELNWAESNDDIAVARFALLRLHNRSSEALLLVNDQSFDVLEQKKLLRLLRKVVKSSLSAKDNLADAASVAEAIADLQRDFDELSGQVSASTANMRIRVSQNASK
jgi:heme exporter protein D